MPFFPDFPNMHQVMHQHALDPELGGINLLPQPRIPMSAAEDDTILGQDAIRGLIGTRTTADAMRLVSQQLNTLIKNTRIVSMRSHEAFKAFNILKEIEAKADIEAPTPIKLGENQDALAMPAMPVPKVPGLQEDFDLDAYRWRSELETLIKSSRQIAYDVQLMVPTVRAGMAAADKAARYAHEVLNLPGAPVPPVQPSKPRTRRPPDLAPFWLDLPYASTHGSDPYAMPEGKIRKADGDLMGSRFTWSPFLAGTHESDAGLDYHEIKTGSGIKDLLKPDLDEAEAMSPVTM